MNSLKQYEVWFITGSQHLYGEETLTQVANHAKEMTSWLDQRKDTPVKILFKSVVTAPDEIYHMIQEANMAKKCVGIIAWMHTFSPAKMWIRGLRILQKPLLHLHTQFNRDIPWEEIDMDFMNLNQSAHGDREFGFILSRMRLRHKVVTGYWQEENCWKSINIWARAACAWHDWQGAKFVRFGDNMRQVAVTEGDKVEAEIHLGYSVNTHGIGDLTETIKEISDKAVDDLCERYAEEYVLADVLQKSGSQHQSLRDAAKIELGLQAFLQQGDYKGFTDTFEDLHGLKQLPGMAVQRLMAKGYGFGAEGDWKTAALVRAMKVMAAGLKGGNSFMEDYTYHFEQGNETVLGAHMLEVCESIAAGKPSCEIHPLGIGGKQDPVRLVFNVGAGPALNASIVDMGNRFRLLVNEVEAVKPEHPLPKLPVARVLWKPYPDMKTGCSAWLLAGGAHHTCFSQNLSTEYLEDFARMAELELILIDKDTRLAQFEHEIRWNEKAFVK
jgi:L-arabinose isomerase